MTKHKVLSVTKHGESPYQFVMSPGESISIGRAPSCDVNIGLNGVSSFHCEMCVELFSDKIPNLIRIASPNGPSAIRGLYVKIDGQMPNGFPLWKKLGEPVWIYSTKNEHWGIGGVQEKEAKFQSGGAYAFCSTMHGGKAPTYAGNSWKRNNPAWTEDDAIVLTDMDDEVPSRLKVVAPNGPPTISGTFDLDPDHFANGFPLWKKQGDSIWIYGMKSKKWGIGGVNEKNVNFDCSGAYVYCPEEHGGKMPFDMGRTWHRNNPAWTKDPDLTVTSLNPSGAKPTTSTSLRLRICDRSTNGVGMRHAPDVDWHALGKSNPSTLGVYTELRVPLRKKPGDSSVDLIVRVLGDSLPDAYDDRRGTGRWRYGAKLGEGGLGIVYRAKDVGGKNGRSTSNGAAALTSQGDVAIKMLKNVAGTRAQMLRRTYILHREAQWSMQVIHNPRADNFSERGAALFAQYLEDHTGVSGWSLAQLDWQAERKQFEAADFDWDAFHPLVVPPEIPYVIMEVVPGQTLHVLMDFNKVPANPRLNERDKHRIMRQAAEALDYLVPFNLVHRDFRTTNMLWDSSGSSGNLVVIDLGHMLLADEVHTQNKSAVVRCNWRETEKNSFDWAPGEVKMSGSRSYVNFALPPHSFDVFSLAVLALQLEGGSLEVARKSRDALARQETKIHPPLLSYALGMDAHRLRQMLGKPVHRPRPTKILSTLKLNAGKMRSSSRSRSRSRERQRVAQQVSSEARRYVGLLGV